MRFVLIRAYNRHTWQNDKAIRMWEANSTNINDSVQKISLFESAAPLSYEAALVHWETCSSNEKSGSETEEGKFNG